jgi:hypothetical protein
LFSYILYEIYIYGLKCPISGEIRYIGKTNDIKRRLRSHIRESKKDGNKRYVYCWIKSLIKETKKPHIEIIDVVDINEWKFWEMYWISQFKAWGFKLTNSTNGGDGGNLRKTKLSDETKLKISEGVKKSHKINPKYNLTDNHPKSLIVLDKDLLYQKYIIENLSQPKCAEFFNVSGKVIWRNLKDYNIKKDKSVWLKQTSVKREEKVVLQYDLKNNFLKEWSGLNEIESVMKTNTKSIRECCCGRQKTAKGYIWKYK